MATVAVDVDGDGIADIVVTGVDLDRDGIPDVLQGPPPAVESHSRRWQSTSPHDMSPRSRSAKSQVGSGKVVAQQPAFDGPTATMALDVSGDGSADVLVTGVDMDQDGIPDALQGRGSAPRTEQEVHCPKSPRGPVRGRGVPTSAATVPVAHQPYRPSRYHEPSSEL